MKIRLGFVSNSSSVSFTIYGVFIENVNRNEELYNLASQLGLFAHFDYDGNNLYIGRKWSSIGNDETGRDFKKSVKEKIALLALKTSLKDVSPLTTFEEGWYDG